ncbi:hypothetical protein F8M41_000164 [Gigaspora margarita]|uniref:Uncharacterized protein n=1 Tax=Gigaspora margarita TaxID=4874 RepID=A0A8H3XH41_GIGMA|nr:hypothetical protein F8M41_000164 [Gigaspora margarita]
MESSFYMDSEQSLNMMEFSYDAEILKPSESLSNNIAAKPTPNFDCEVSERSLVSDTMKPSYDAEILDLLELLSNAIFTPNFDCEVSERLSVSDTMESLYNANNILKPLEPLPNNVAAVLPPNYDYVVSEFKQP